VVVSLGRPARARGAGARRPVAEQLLGRGFARAGVGPRATPLLSGAPATLAAATPAHSGCSSLGTPENPSLPSEPLLAWHHADSTRSSPYGLRGNCTAGGVFYTLGAVFFLAERIRFFHFVWHLFVIAGTACHFIAVLRYAA